MPVIAQFTHGDEGDGGIGTIKYIFQCEVMTFPYSHTNFPDTNCLDRRITNTGDITVAWDDFGEVFKHAGV
jgi:hypothetical protein